MSPNQKICQAPTITMAMAMANRCSSNCCGLTLKPHLVNCPFGSAFHIFFLLGPFFLLIERTPADIWLSLIALIFAVRAFIRRDFTWLRVAWVRLAFLFWMACLTSAAMSPLPSYSLGSFAWFRFPLAMAAGFGWPVTDVF